jgi:PAS domain S-box-containing protein
VTPRCKGIRLPRAWIPTLVSLILLVPGPAAFAQDGTSAKNVLVLYSFSDRALFDPLDALKSAIRSRVPFPVNFYAEYMDTQRFEDGAYEKSLSESFRYAYRKQRLDLVMVAAYPALRFALSHRDEIFPDVPLVFFYMHGGRLNDGKPPPGVTGATETVDVRGSLDLAFRLQPATRNIAVVTGTTEFERYWLGVFRREFRPFQDNIKLTEFVGIPGDRLLDEMSALPSDTAVFVQLSPQSTKVPVLGTYDETYGTLTAISQRFRTYCIFSSLCLNRGGIGGSYSVGNQQLDKVAAAAARILSGEKPEDIPVAEDPRVQVRVDLRQLHRWNIPESALPPGSLVLYRESTFWQRYRKLVVGFTLFIALQALLVAAWVGQRAKKRKVEVSLLESEEQCRTMAEAAPALIWVSDENGQVTYLNNRILEFTGASAEALLGKGWAAYVHPEDLTGVMVARTRAMDQREGLSMKFRLRRKDGAYRGMLYFKTPRFHVDGAFAGFIGSAVDISDQQTAQEALEELGGRLIDAQEQERSRIARELHDDICQRLAILTLEIEQSMKASASMGVPNDHMQEVWQHCSEITGDVQALSHELHSSMLDHLGIVAATRNFCNEFSAKQGVAIKFSYSHIPASIARNTSLCLFRVTQEALHNAVKHSGVRSYEVDLQGRRDGLDLEIRDAGVGLDLGDVKKTGGLGLISMQERVHLVKGVFAIISKPNGGTIIHASVPLSVKRNKSGSHSETDEEKGLQHATRSYPAS